MNARIQSLTARETEVTYCGVRMVVSFEYEPEERALWSPVHGGIPGSPANAILISAKVGGVDIAEMLSNEQREHIEDLILEQMQ